MFKIRSSSSLFDDAQVLQDLRRRTVRGAATTFTGQGLSFLLGIVSTAVLARLLTPEDFGLIAMTTVFTGFIALFQDAGLTMATVQDEKITHPQVSTLFWLNVLLACAISAVMWFGAPAVAAFFNEPRLTGVTRGLALAFLISGATVQHTALLRRQLRFTVLTVLNIGSSAVGIIVGIVMALLGYSYWALVGMAIGNSLAKSLSVWMVIPWMPCGPTRGVGVRRMLRFGGDVLSFNIINYFSRQADTLLLGWMWGPTVLAFYDKAYGMLLLPIRRINGPMTSVIVPALSRVKSQPKRYSRLFLQALELLTGVSIPVILGFCVFADDLVLLWLGSQWTACVHLFRLLTIAAVVGALLNTTGWLMISSGNTRMYKWAGVLGAVLYVSSFVIGLPYGAEGVSIAYSIATLINFYPAWWMATKNTPVTIPQVLRAFAPAVVSAIAAAAVGYLVSRFGFGVRRPLRTVLAVLAYGATYSALLLVCFKRWQKYYAVIHELRPKRQGSSSGSSDASATAPAIALARKTRATASWPS
jgi:O-antigen/teichoic acid export membrane protein